MWLVVGLGNPGPKYEWTRHNCGFLVVDELARRAGRLVRTPECQSLTARVSIGLSGRPAYGLVQTPLQMEEAILVKPQTFMNLSGVAVSALVRKHEISAPSRVLVISDDLALPIGRIRIRREGSAGGHNGLKSIIEKLGSSQFPRLRVGIAPDHQLTETKDFVLAEFSRQERSTLEEMIGTAADAVESILTEGIEPSMSKYN